MKSATTTARATIVDRQVLGELALATIDDTAKTVKLERQLDRKLYVAVNEVLAAIGGAWNRKARAHTFATSPKDAIELVLATGQVVTHKDLGWFPTPAALAKQLVERADVHRGHSLLEPSAGEGAIASVAASLGARVTCVELHAGRAATLRGAGFETIEGDFLSMDTRSIGAELLPFPRLFDRVVMNPPFSPGRADLLHVEHALRFLARGGRLVAVMAAGVTFRQDAQTQRFQRMVTDMGGRIEALPAGSFEESGTSVNTCLLEVSR